MRAFIAIVIDQLGWQDRLALPALDEFLGPPRLVNTSYLPTVTETAHATISVAAAPAAHGIIGAETFRRRRVSLRHVKLGEDAFTPRGLGRGRPRLRSLHRAGVQCFVIAGKVKVAQLLDPRPLLGPGPSARITYQWADDLNSYKLEAVDEDGRDFTADLPSHVPRRLESLADERVDEALFDMASFALTDLCDPEFADPRPVFLFLGLHRLDVLGHWHRRTDPPFTSAIRRINELLREFLLHYVANHGDEVVAVATSDHGCRAVDRTVVLSPSGNFLEVWAGGEGEPERIPLPVDDLLLDPRSDDLPAIVFDGGTARLWVKRGRAQRVAGSVNRDATPYIRARPQRELDVLFGGDTALSRHRNWGDVVALAGANVALCKWDWVFRRAKRIPELVVGEHGTGDPEDRNVPCWGDLNGHEDLFGAAERLLVRR